MKSIRSRAALLTTGAVILAAFFIAPKDVAATHTLLEQSYEEVHTNVWQQLDANGITESIATGPEGLAWALMQVNEESNRQLELFLAAPSSERLSYIQALAKTAELIRSDLSKAAPTSLGDALLSMSAQASGCNDSYIATAEASPENPGASASSSAGWWSNSCGNRAEVYCHASARSGSITDTETLIVQNTTDASGSCNASVTGATDCHSFASSHVYVPSQSLYVQREDTNTTCTLVPLTANLSCSLASDGFIDCTAAPTGGAPPYRAFWKLGSGSETEATPSPGPGPWSVFFLCKRLTPEGLTEQVRIVDSAGTEVIETSTWCQSEPDFPE